jgi:hypothetical protein
MPRQIITSKCAQAMAKRREGAAATPTGGGAETPPDEYKDRLVKLIPAEVVAVYLFISGLVSATDPEKTPQGLVLTIVFVVLLLLTLPYLSRVARVTNPLQLGISTGAFVVWVFSLGGPFVYLMKLVGLEYQPIYGAIVLPIYTFAVPIFDNQYTGPPER